MERNRRGEMKGRKRKEERGGVGGVKRGRGEKGWGS